MTKYGIIYGGGAGKADWDVDGPYNTIDEARAAYDERRRVCYGDGLVGGASIVELDTDLSPGMEVESIIADIEPGRGRELKLYSNNAYDTLILCQDGRAIAEWTADRETVASLLDAMADPSSIRDWDEHDVCGVGDVERGELVVTVTPDGVNIVDDKRWQARLITYGLDGRCGPRG